MIPSPYFYAGLFLAGVAAGGYAVHTWHRAQEVEAIEQAREDERDLQGVADQADRQYVDEIERQRDRARRNAGQFKEVLNAKNRELADCRVDADLLGVLDDAGQLPGAAADPAEPGPGSARAEAPPLEPLESTCAAELDRARANYAEVCVPNAVHVRELREFTRNLIREYNRAVGRD